MGCIGLVGGLAIASACHYYKALGQAQADSADSLELCLVHAHVPKVFEYVSANDPERLASYLLGFIDRLKGAGATLVVIPAVTPHFCIARLKELSPLPIVDLLEIIVEEVKSRQLKRVAIFGTKYVVGSNLFGALDDVVDVVGLAPAELDRVHALYLGLAQKGFAESTDILDLNALGKTVCDRDGLDAILLAGTDFSAVPASAIEFPHVDCTEAHLRAISHRSGTH